VSKLFDFYKNSPTAGFKHAGYEIAIDVLNRAQSLDKNKLREAIAQTNLNTIIGPIKFNDQNYCALPCASARWVKGKRFPGGKGMRASDLPD